jgi:hypothetical protein
MDLKMAFKVEIRVDESLMIQWKEAFEALYKSESSRGRSLRDLHLIPVAIHNLLVIFQVPAINSMEIS